MWGRIIKTTVQVSLFLSVAYFLRACYLEKQTIRIESVSQPITWMYDIITPPIIGERMYYVLIDGELDQDAGLERQIQRTTSPIKGADTTFVDAATSTLPKGKFSMYYNRDDSGPETFIYHPFKASKGWIRIQISPGQWNNKDSSRIAF